VVRAALVFVVLYWMYSGYAWLTNQVPPTTSSRRLLLVCGMASFLICALAIPRAFERTALAFSLGYVLVVLVHSGLYAQVHGATVWRSVPRTLASCSSPQDSATR
jgi:low temperature requirement protein LtrA